MGELKAVRLPGGISEVTFTEAETGRQVTLKPSGGAFHPKSPAEQTALAMLQPPEIIDTETGEQRRAELPVKRQKAAGARKTGHRAARTSKAASVPRKAPTAPEPALDESKGNDGEAG